MFTFGVDTYIVLPDLKVADALQPAEGQQMRLGGTFHMLLSQHIQVCVCVCVIMRDIFRERAKAEKERKKDQQRHRARDAWVPGISASNL